MKKLMLRHAPLLIPLWIYFATILQVLFVGGVTYAYFAPSYLSYHNLPFPIVNPVVVPGETVLMLVGRCNSSKRPRIYTTTREMVSQNGDIITIAATSVVVTPGCSVITSGINTVPLDAKPGIYIMRGIVETSDYGFARTVHWSSQPFEVRPQKERI